MNILSSSIINLSSITHRQAMHLSETVRINTLGELLSYYPYRYEDRRRVYDIRTLEEEMHAVQIRGKITRVESSRKGKKRLTATLKDRTGHLQLVWFHRTEWFQRFLKVNTEYLVFGQPSKHLSSFSITHPDLVEITPKTTLSKGILPLYSTSQKLTKAGVDNQTFTQLQQEALSKAIPYIRETLPPPILEKYDLLPRKEALSYIHFPPDKKHLAKARYRLKFEELLYLQLHLLQRKKLRNTLSEGQKFANTSLLTKYYHDHLPFPLTDDQKKVIKEICRDMRSGHQMNRLLQGDVGSGKTIVAFLCGLLPIADETQTAILAPTEVLANQHYHKLKPAAENLGLTAALLTGSTPTKARKPIIKALADGTLKILIGTHALLEDKVQFKQLGLAVIDEQHRFGVAQRAKIWGKNKNLTPPHILVMTATPIPRTLAMALYGDLDVSIIQEKPKGRKPIITAHYDDKNRLLVFARMRAQIEAGHQVYIVYPRIISSDGEETYKDLMDGYESVCRAFPNIPVSILHGKMQPVDKAYEMKRFVKGETKIMVGTTILEVGINVPNATMIIIENAESFGLAQLHQLRGRVGRDDAQSYCLLLTKEKLSYKAKQRIKTMVKTQDGFQIAQVDLQSRGPGDMLGVQQSGLYKLKLADLTHDHEILQKSHRVAEEILETDPFLQRSVHVQLRKIIQYLSENTHWSVIS